MNESVQWTHLSLKEFVVAFAKRGVNVSTKVVRSLLKIHGYGRRKLSKCATIGEHADRNAQFEHINSVISAAKENSNTVILSTDTKKKELTGNLFREGEVYTQESIKVYDHDFTNLSTGKIVPHGIFDLKRNECYLNLGTSADTSDFAGDSLMAWWDNHAKVHYTNAKEIIILCDGGGSNRSSGFLYKDALQTLANHIQKEIRICHYPPYCSKYNPIEHRAFPHITRALSGIVLDSTATAKQLIEQKAITTTGFKTIVNVIEKVYEKGKKLTQEAKDAILITFEEVQQKWNYTIKPNVSP